MNYCTVCKSLYSVPRTCNCFWGTPGAPATQTVPFPLYPSPPMTIPCPIYPTTMPWVTVTCGGGATSGGTTGTATWQWTPNGLPTTAEVSSPAVTFVRT